MPFLPHSCLYVSIQVLTHTNHVIKMRLPSDIRVKLLHKANPPESSIRMVPFQIRLSVTCRQGLLLALKRLINPALLPQHVRSLDSLVILCVL